MCENNQDLQGIIVNDDENIVLANVDKLNINSQQLIDKIVDSSPDEAKSIINLFALNEAKKNMIRMNKLNTLYDNITDKMLLRVEKTPDNFSNDDLVKIMKTTQDAIDKTNSSIKQSIETPNVAIQQINNVTIQQAPVLSRESRERVLDTVQKIMQQIQQANQEQKYDAEVIDAEVIDETVVEDVEEKDETTNE